MSKHRRVFLSYAHGDRAFGAKLRRGLTDAGVDTFDAAHTAAGESVFEKLRRQIADSDLVVFVVPSFEGEGRWTLAEVGAARALEKQIIAILPNSARYANSNFARAITELPILDASRISDSALINTIVSSAGAH
jgi:nucleoside 2-deoxyribosyltransferase